MKSPTSSTLCLTLWIASLGMASVDTHQFLIKSDARGVTSLRRAADSSLEFIAPDHRLGQVILRYRSGGHTDWVTVDSTAGAMDQLTVEGDYRQARDVDAIRLTQSWTEEAGVLRWHVSVTNTRDTWIEIGDVELPLPMFTQYGKFERHEDRVINLTKRLFRHAHISGHGSFVYWMPVCGVGSHLVLTPVNGTSLEYFEDSGASYAHGGVQYRVYAHSAATGPTRPGTWRQAHTSRRLEPTETASYTFEFRWADDLAGVRDALVSSGGFDIHVVSGMVVPTDLDARFAIRTHNRMVQVVPEFPKSTTIEELTSPDQDTRIWRVAFSRLGENRLTIHTVDGKRAYLEFFSTVPIESLIKRRAAFIHERQQHRDPAVWYDGLFSLYDTTMKEGRCRLGPDNPGGQHPYAVSGSDDPSNSKCIYLSEKNVVWPEASEIASLEYFIEHFVWGKHQRTDKETPYPYGIYGSDSWLVNRNADRDPIEQGISRPGGPSACRMWRSFDY
ncbi:MAG: hypothetical protein K9N55_11615, partial [Phycisphaerae bacterium]|nr:hypothetical protein [Phycisphaerae bacterium]